MMISYARLLGCLSLLALGVSCARGDKQDPGRAGDLTFIWDAESLTRVQGRVEAVNPVPPADTRTLAWTAPGDDARSGEATLYDIRYISSRELTKRGWTPELAFSRFFEQTLLFPNEPQPSPAGTLERWFLPRLDVSESYYFAMRVEDEVGRFSKFSNIAGPAQLSLLALNLPSPTGPEPGLGTAVANAPDLSGDKIGDLVAGSPLQGRVYVYFGAGTNDLLDNVEVNQIKIRKVKSELLPAITLTGSAAEEFGAAVAGVGKVNLSPKADLVVGAPAADTGAGKVYLFDGNSLAKGEAPAAKANVVIFGDAAGDNLGAQVAGLGDLNRDGFSDFAVSAPGAGKVYVFLGGDAASTRGPLPTGQTAGQAAALILTGEAPGDGFGQGLAWGGDLNGDNISDLVVAAAAAVNPDNGVAAGAVYVFYGGDAGGIKFKTDLSAAGSQKAWDLSAGPEADVTLRGTTTDERFGSAFTSAGDLRKRPAADTATDLAIGAAGEGRIYIFYAGSVSGKIIFPASVTGLVWQDLDRQEVLEGDTAAGFGESLAGPGDINLDGYADLVVGLPGSEAVKIYFWTLDDPASDFRTLLLTSTPGSGFGWGLASAGDLNQDNYADLIIGAPLAGLAYLEF